jgi:hypothetical protein
MLWPQLTWVELTPAARTFAPTRSAFRLPAVVANRAMPTGRSTLVSPPLALAAGLDGVTEKIDPGEPNEDSLYTISEAERRQRNIGFPPQTLQEAVTAFAADPLMEATLGKELCDEFVKYKLAERDSYHLTVSQWEIERYRHLF